MLRSEPDRVLLRSGIAAGDRVCLTPIVAATVGMPVRIREEDGR
ncbi:MAG: hypothetical protein U1E73_10750 [Planctomycetota bacterium]